MNQDPEPDVCLDLGPGNGPIAVEVRELTKRYGRVWALRDCGFRLPAHRIIALVGANGAGKSTLMSVVSGLLPATAGSVLVDGRPVTSRRRARADGAAGDGGSRVAILGQDKPLYRDFSAADMLRFGRWTNRVWDQRRALAWLARFEVPLDRPCARLSGGQRTQVALAVALGTRPTLLLLDEPLADLDPVARTEVAGELLAEAADGGMTVVLSTHVVAELAGISDHLLLLAGGRPVLAGGTEELLARHVRLSGPRAERPPLAGTVVRARHTDRQSTFTVRLPGATPADTAGRADAAGGARVTAPGWSARPVPLDDLVISYLRASGTAPLGLEAAA
ncbi:ABC transporter ATP-binding protein [Actinacidiphila rubida]|uniref:ABC-2 type transport system ATP-binding protein n=1 Tax=Actinacidiphila rubida TaxID=310780 RepID=A0A1H8STA8_9ACTN|nr:ABC transporter ATP-binding protein [Actinacidiphila rubida]SEO81922.1 ABC-2 type transport system ATP-binding protein [Actinacidiphila rubida]